MFDKSKALTLDVISYVNSYYSGDLDRMRSINRYIFILCAGAVSWKASLQSIAALSMTKVEYVVATEGVKEATWLQGFLIELGIAQ